VTEPGPPAPPDGTLTIEGDSATLRFERRLPHPIEAVWAALTEPAQRAAWFGPTRIEGRPGGRIELEAQGPPASPAQRRISGRILVWDPPRVLEHEWRQPLVGAGVVRYELVPDGDATRLTFTHRGLPVGPARGLAPGTHAYLDRLRAHLDGAPLPAWGA
jgi:uncharacterized protein YndB with AHSA1/START domain